MKYIALTFVLIIFLVFLEACGASTETRYEKENGSTESESADTIVSIQEDFDISPYKTTINIEDFNTDKEGFSDIWYQYDSFQDDSISGVDRKIIGTVDGFRVMVSVTDNMEEANTVREDISL